MPMRFKTYSARLASHAWISFTRKLRTAGGCTCVACGSRQGIQAHHMRYGRMGTTHEWQDIALLCQTCHEAYHQRVKTPPTTPARRIELLLEMIAVIMRGKVDTSFFHAHGEAMNEHWIKTRIVEDSLLENASRGRSKPKRPKKVKLTVHWKPRR